MLESDTTTTPENGNTDSGAGTTDTDSTGAGRAAPARKRAPRKTAAKAPSAPVTTEPATTEPANTDPGTAGPASAQPVTTEPAAENAAAQAAPAPRKRAPRKATAKAAAPPRAAPAEQTPAATVPSVEAAAESAAVEPAAAPTKRAPRKSSRATKATKSAAEPATIEPATIEPATIEPATIEPASTEPAAEATLPLEAEALAATAKQVPAKRAPRKRVAKKTAPVDASDPVDDAAAENAAAEDAEPDAAPVAPTVLFMAPQDEAPPTRRRRVAKKAAGAPVAADSREADGSTGPPADTQPPAPTDAAEPESAEPESDEEGTDPDDIREAAIEQANGARRRRRRGRRGRGGGGTGEDSTGDDSADETTTSDDDTPATAEQTDGPEDSDDEGEEKGGGTRRRRRRRRSGNGGDDSAPVDDPPNTVTHVRDKKSGKGDSDDGVRGIKGSTRLEAKRQRRRDGRDTGRRRAPILTEAEFLARREAVDRVMAVRQNGDRTQIAVLEDDILVEHYVTRASATSYVGNVYLGRVQNVLPSMEAAFIDIGKGRNGVLYAGEVNWDAAGLDGKSRTIEHALKGGDSVLVQVTKDPIGHKGARLTSQISLPGRFLVYVPGGGMTGISRRLPDTERHRLKSILKKIVPDEAGVIVRTAAEGASEEDLTHDVERLQAQWESIQEKATKTKSAPTLVHGEPDLAIRVVRDVFNEDFASLVVQGDDAWSTVSEYVGGVAPDLAERVSRHTKDTDLFHDLRVDEQLMKALDRKVWLPSGGSLVIDRTEAMTVVDVNTGKFVGSGGNLEQTVTRNNLEAAEEIVRQLRLRDVGGIVVIDFIDMVLESNRDLVLRRLTECLGRDRTKHQVAEVTSLGLVQMTRKRVGEGLLEAFSEPCEACHGRGVLIHTEPVDQSSASSSEDEPASGKGRRRRGKGGQQEPADVPVEPPATPEQRQAANAAIAAIHRAAALEKEEAAAAGGVVAELATNLVAAAMEAGSVATEPVQDAAVPDETSTIGSEPQAAVVTEPEAAVGTEPEAAVGTEPETVVTEPTTAADVEPESSEVVSSATETPVHVEPDAVHGPDHEPVNGHVPTDQPANGAMAPVRRRRRAASRPAGPPVATP